MVSRPATVFRAVVGGFGGLLLGTAVVASAWFRWKMRMAVMAGLPMPTPPTSAAPLLPYLLVFPAAGVASGLLWSLRPRPVRYMLIGAIAAGAAAAFLAAAAPYRNPWIPQLGTVSQETFVGAALGALAGALLAVVDWWRGLRARLAD